MVVCYDELVPLEAQAKMATAAAANEEGEWKEARRDILAAVRAVAMAGGGEDGACPEGPAAEHYR